MSRKPSLVAACLSLIVAAVPAGAAVLGPDAATCASGGPAMLVQVTGLKNRIGWVRVRSFTGDPSTYFTKGKQVNWIEVPIPAVGPVEICVKVARPGAYAVDVRHDVNLNHKTDFSDGAGLSGNPNLGVLDVILKRRPPASVTQVRVAGGVVRVPVTLRYKG